MGGCASKPKESDIVPESLPAEAPVSPNKTEGETVAQDKNGGVSEKEAPLEDLSEPKEEVAERSEPKAVEVETLVSIEAEAAKPDTEKQNVEVVAMAEEKVEKPEEPTVVAKAPKEEKASDATPTSTTQEESDA